jgi:hypothetical protein
MFVGVREGLLGLGEKKKKKKKLGIPDLGLLLVRRICISGRGDSFLRLTSAVILQTLRCRQSAL